MIKIITLKYIAFCKDRFHLNSVSLSNTLVIIHLVLVLSKENFDLNNVATNLEVKSKDLKI
jgi:hypothetical protein